MTWYNVVIIVAVSIILLSILTAYVCYKMTFYNKPTKFSTEEISLPNNKIYNTYKELIVSDILFGKEITRKDYKITSYDGLKLNGSFYKTFENAPIEIMFHGYKGSGKRDLSTGIRRAKACGRNVLLVDQRAHDESEGHIISFGIKERYDVLSWIEFSKKEFGNDIKIILTGVSMGAATVLMASNLDLPNNVIGILADCGYDSPKNIIKKYIKDRKLPPEVFYPFVFLGALLFGHFKLNSSSPIECVKEAKVPIIFIHGESDTFIPYQMSENLYNSCNSRKHITIIKNAEHGISYLIEPELYVNELNEFFKN